VKKLEIQLKRSPRVVPAGRVTPLLVEPVLEAATAVDVAATAISVVFWAGIDAVVTETKLVAVLAPARLATEVNADDATTELVELVFFLQTEALEVALVRVYPDAPVERIGAVVIWEEAAAANVVAWLDVVAASAVSVFTTDVAMLETADDGVLATDASVLA